MTDDTMPAPETAGASTAPLTETPVPQVGDILPGGVVAGVRISADIIEISFNGADWLAHI